MRAEADHAGGEEVHLRPDLVPAEEQHGEETGLEEKGEDAFGGESGTKDIADETRVGGPVRPELEFHDDAGGHADGEGEREDARPEAGHLVKERVAGAQPGGLHGDEDNAESDAQRRIDVVKCDGERELQSRQQQDVHFRTPSRCPCGSLSPTLRPYA